jgi:hypothetical protein
VIAEGCSAFVFLLIAASAAAVTVLGYLGIVHIPKEVWWLPSFFSVIFGLTALSHLWMAYSRIKQTQHTQALRESGLRGLARILHVEQTGVSVNDNPQVRCSLEINVPGVPAYTVTVKAVVPIIKVGLLTSPNPLPVFVNPSDLNDILIDW